MAVSWCDGYDEGQRALVHALRLWSCSVCTYTHTHLLTHTYARTCKKTRYFLGAWRVADDYSTRRKYTKETHTSLLIRLTTTPHTQTPHLSYICTLPRHSHIHQTTHSTQNTKNMARSVQHNNRAENLLAVLRQVVRQVSQMIWAFIPGPQSLPHSNQSARK